jgi:membrane protease subunit (stomatin/prohibitin family)
MVRVDLRTVVLDVPPQDVITRDNVSVKVNAVLYFRVLDPQKAIIQVEDFLVATSQLAQTTLRAVLGKHELDELLAEREQLNGDIREVLDAQTDAWGIKVANVEIKHVDLNESMVRAIARQAEAERERRAKVIHAEGELQASEKLMQAAQMLGKEPGAMQLRYMQTLGDRRGQELDHCLPDADRPARGWSTDHRKSDSEGARRSVARKVAAPMNKPAKVGSCASAAWACAAGATPAKPARCSRPSPAGRR